MLFSHSFRKPFQEEGKYSILHEEKDIPESRKGGKFMNDHTTNLQNSQGFQEILETMEDGVYFTDLHRVITRWNKAAERISGYSAEAVVGSSCRDNILVHVDEAGNSLCLGMCPLAFTMEDGQPRETKVYLHHKEGHRVPVMIRALPQRDSEGKIIGGIELFTDMSVRENLEFQIEQLQRLAMLDPLTSLPNRRYLQSRMEGMHQEFLKNGIPWGVLFFDIDRFKRVNDTYGHDMGDRVLIMVSKTLSLASGPFDTIARWGGEEFAGIFPNVTLESLEKTAERLRMLVEHSWTEEEELHINVTISIGGTVATSEETPEETVHRADKLMYRSKEEGRNRCTLE
jgi:diguanylate cyclase (GGDEF)-like protein/PAS domain S-box-containing protein